MPAEATADTPALSIAKFDKALHDRSAFCCGFGPIDNFLKLSLSDQIKDKMLVAWMATADDSLAVVGFYTLSALAVRAGLGPKKWQRGRIQDVPVIYVRALGVHEDMQGRGYGTALMIDAMRRCLRITDQMGAAAIVLDILEDDHFERRWKFYTDLGFWPLNDPDNLHRVFIPMGNVKATLG